MRTRYFRIAVTERCNLRCKFCHREGQAQDVGTTLSAKDIGWTAEVAMSAGFQKFKLTGGEPTLRRDLAEIVRECRRQGIDDLSLITNGTRLLASAKVLRDAGLPRLNVSLKTLNADRYRLYSGRSGPELEVVLRGIDEALAVGFRNMKLNFVYQGAESQDDFWDVCRFAAGRGLVVVLLPVLGKRGAGPEECVSLGSLHKWLLQSGAVADSVTCDAEGIRRTNYQLDGGIRVLLRSDELGSVAPYSRCKHCANRPECREGIFPTRLLADGTVLPCLAATHSSVALGDRIRQRDRNAVITALERAAAN